LPGELQTIPEDKPVIFSNDRQVRTANEWFNKAIWLSMKFKYIHTFNKIYQMGVKQKAQKNDLTKLTVKDYNFSTVIIYIYLFPYFFITFSLVTKKSLTTNQNQKLIWTI
jgi:hypothetical protein